MGTLSSSTNANNLGFLRYDAPLVVTVITDEEDNGKSTGTLETWKAALVDAKHGRESTAVIPGLIGDLDLPETESICVPLDANLLVGAEPSPMLRRFVRSFAHALDTSVCAEDYRPFFKQVVKLVGQACEG